MFGYSEMLRCLVCFIFFPVFHFAWLMRHDGSKHVQEKKQKLPWKDIPPSYSTGKRTWHRNSCLYMYIYIYYILQLSLPFWIQSSLDKFGSPCLCRPHGSKIGSGKTRTLASMVTQLNHFGWTFVGNHIEPYYHSKSLRVYIFSYELPKKKRFVSNI